MADEPATNNDPTPDPTPDPEPAKDSDTLGEAGKKALEAERKAARAEKKRADDLAARLKEFEDRDKSDLDKASERATAAEERAAKAETDLARFQVALEKGLTPSQAKRLVGATREELEADADELLKDLGDAGKPRPPKPDPTQGKPAGQADPGPGLDRLRSAYSTAK